MSQSRKQRAPKRRGEPTEASARRSVDPKSHAAFSGRLRIALKSAGASVLSIAQAAGVSDSTIHLWLKGSEPSREKLIALAGATRVSVEWLATGRGEMRADGPAGYIVPSWHSERAPVLFELDWFRKNIGPVVVAEEIAKGLGAQEPEQFAAPHLFNVTDDSMEPTLRNGDLILARDLAGGAAEAPTNGIYLVWFRDRVLTGKEIADSLKSGRFPSRTFPRRIEWSENSFLVKCDNPAYPKPIEVAEKDFLSVIVTWRVVWHGRIL